jgi:hypothetical protein
MSISGSSSGDTIQALRQWASEWCLTPDRAGVYSRELGCGESRPGLAGDGCELEAWSRTLNYLGFGSRRA